MQRTKRQLSKGYKIWCGCFTTFENSRLSTNGLVPRACVHFISLLSFDTNLRFGKQKLGFSLRNTHKLEKKAIFKEEQDSYSTKRPDRVWKRPCSVWVLCLSLYKFFQLENSQEHMQKLTFKKYSPAGTTRAWSCCKHKSVCLRSYTYVLVLKICS